MTYYLPGECSYEYRRADSEEEEEIARGSVLVVCDPHARRAESP